jgi:hypothetical protein
MNEREYKFVKGIGFAALGLMSAIGAIMHHFLWFWIFISFATIVMFRDQLKRDRARLKSEAELAHDLGAMEVIEKLKTRFRDLQEKALALEQGIYEARSEKRQYDYYRVDPNPKFREQMNLGIHFYYLLHKFAELIQDFITKKEFPAFPEQDPYFDYMRNDY